jgi:hypothetical protein
MVPGAMARLSACLSRLYRLEPGHRRDLVLPVAGWTHRSCLPPVVYIRSSQLQRLDLLDRGCNARPGNGNSHLVDPDVERGRLWSLERWQSVQRLTACCGYPGFTQWQCDEQPDLHLERSPGRDLVFPMGRWSKWECLQAVVYIRSSQLQWHNLFGKRYHIEFRCRHTHLVGTDVEQRGLWSVE